MWPESPCKIMCNRFWNIYSIIYWYCLSWTVKITPPLKCNVAAVKYSKDNFHALLRLNNIMAFAEAHNAESGLLAFGDMICSGCHGQPADFLFKF